MTLFYRESPLTGEWNSRDIPITHEQFEQCRIDGIVIQAAFPQLSESDREFLISGYTDQDWEQLAPVIDTEGHDDGADLNLMGDLPVEPFEVTT